jgi:hypothetical protein
LLLTALWGFVQAQVEAHFSRAVRASSASRGKTGAGSRIDLNKALLSHDAA